MWSKVFYSDRQPSMISFVSDRFPEPKLFRHTFRILGQLICRSDTDLELYSHDIGSMTQLTAWSEHSLQMSDDRTGQNCADKIHQPDNYNQESAYNQ
jgi:hypothetical protein